MPEDDSEIPRRGGTDRRSELLYRTSKDLPSALQSRSRNRSTVHHGWLLERVVHRNPLHVRYEKLSAGILPAGDRCAGKQSGSVAGSGICAGYVGTYH